MPNGGVQDDFPLKADAVHVVNQHVTLLNHHFSYILFPCVSYAFQLLHGFSYKFPLMFNVFSTMFLVFATLLL